MLVRVIQLTDSLVTKNEVIKLDTHQDQDLEKEKSPVQSDFKMENEHTCGCTNKQENAVEVKDGKSPVAESTNIYS